MHIFRTNEFFSGITLPTPEVMEPIESRLPRQAQTDQNLVDFLKVHSPYTQLYLIKTLI